MAGDVTLFTAGPTLYSPRPGLSLIIEMPAAVKGLETIDGIVYAILAGGATIPINGLLDAEQKPEGMIQ